MTRDIVMDLVAGGGGRGVYYRTTAVEMVPARELTSGLYAQALEVGVQFEIPHQLGWFYTEDEVQRLAAAQLDPRYRLTSQMLRNLVSRRKPPRSWYEEEGVPF